MRGRVADGVAVARAVAGALRRAEASFLAAAVAYYAFVSLVPLAGLALAVSATLGRGRVADRLLAATGDVLTPTGRSLVEEALAATPGRATLTLVGTPVLVWGALKGLRAIDRAFARVDDSAGQRGTLEGVRRALAALGGVGLGVAALVLVGAGLARVRAPLVAELGVVALAGALVVVFLPLYVVFPSPPMGPREALPGAVLAGVGWTVLGALFGLYVSVAGNFAAYGLLGGVLLVLSWLYVGALLLMAGAALNAVLAGRAGPAAGPADAATGRYNRPAGEGGGER